MEEIIHACKIHMVEEEVRRLFMVVLRREGVLTQYLGSKEDESMTTLPNLIKILGEDKKKK